MIKDNKKIFKEKLISILKEDMRVWTDENEIDQPQLLKLIEKYDEKIIKILYQDDEIRKNFFVKIGEIFIFKYDDFKFYIEEHRPLDNSYTELKNRIGLTDGKRFIKDSSDIVLNFPFKDCILEGGQSSDEGMEDYYEYFEADIKEENLNKVPELIGEKERITLDKKGNNIYNIQGFQEKKSKRKEIFFNEVLAKDEIDRLLDKKALTNWKRYTSNGCENVGEIKKDKNGIIKENLIIKGNNLLALHSLKSKFAGKVKLIYIDPPYNTGSDSFAYNDNFNHSTWLTFMKNRLEVAKELLSDDGLIFLQIDCSRQNAGLVKGSSELGYLMVLCDEIFDRKNYIGQLHWKKKKQPSFLSRIAGIMETILIYSKNEANIGKLALESGSDTTKKIDNATNNKAIRVIKEGVLCKSLKNGIIEAGNYKNKTMETIYLDDVEIRDGRTMNSFRAEAKFLNTQSEIDRFCDENLFFITENNSFRRYKDEIEKNKLKSITDLILDWGQNQDANDELMKLFELNGTDKVFATPKPELLLKNIIACCTKENDVILDFFVGSGTTSAVAHKMNRQYIGIEQMDYINDVTIKRMEKVINGEQGGISKDVDWQGGGDFIYAELTKNNEKAKEKIMKCETYVKLLEIFDELYERYFLNYNLKIKEFKEKIMVDQRFLDLSLEDKKKMFLTMLDLNQMYVNATDMEDEKYQLSEEDINLTKDFYEEGSDF